MIYRAYKKFTKTATQWVSGWSRLVTGYNQAEEAQVKPFQNLPLHSKTALKPYNTRKHWAKLKINYDKKQAKQHIARLPSF